MTKTCETCAHYYASVDRKNRLSLKCRRLQVKKDNPLFNGFVIYVGKTLDCQRERGLDKPWYEIILGPPGKQKKCGEDGEFWIPIEKKEEDVQ